MDEDICRALRKVGHICLGIFVLVFLFDRLQRTRTTACSLASGQEDHAEGSDHFAAASGSGEAEGDGRDDEETQEDMC